MIRIILINAFVFLSMIGFVAAQSPDDNHSKDSLQMLNGDLKRSDSVRVTVKSNPQEAHLYINGTYKGQTPVEMFLPPGNYRIYLSSSDKKSLLYATEKITGEQTLYYMLRDVLREFTERDTNKYEMQSFQEKSQSYLINPSFQASYYQETPYKPKSSKYETQTKKEARENDKTFERISKAINQNNVIKINKLVSTNNNIELKGKQGETPLLYAIKRNRIEMVKVLIDAGANIHAFDNNGDGVLHYAIRYSNSNDLIFDFLDLGIELDRKNNRGYTPMLFSIIFKSSDLTFLLIESGADVNKTTINGENGLHLAIRSDSDTLFSFFISQKLNIEQVSHSGGTPLLLAMRNGYKNNEIDKKILELINAGAQIRSSYLDDAIWMDYKFVVDSLLKNGMTKPMTCSTNDLCFRTAYIYSVFAGMADESEQLVLYKNALNIFKLAKEKYRTDLGKIQAKNAAIIIGITAGAILTAGAIASAVPGGNYYAPTSSYYNPTYVPQYNSSSSSYYSRSSLPENYYFPELKYPSKNNAKHNYNKYLRQQLKLCNAQIKEIKKKIKSLENNNQTL